MNGTQPLIREPDGESLPPTYEEINGQDRPETPIEDNQLNTRETHVVSSTIHNQEDCDIVEEVHVHDEGGFNANDPVRKQRLRCQLRETAPEEAPIGPMRKMRLRNSKIGTTGAELKPPS
jgi:hypothetical protein